MMRPIPSAGMPVLLFFVALVFAGCPTSQTVTMETPPFQGNHRIVFLNGDTLSGTITDGEVMAMHVATERGDTVRIENETVSRVLSAQSGADITTRYVDRDLIGIQKARIAIDRQQAQLKAEVESGKRKKTDWTLRTTFALVLVKFEQGEAGIPEVSLTLYNFGDKAIALFKAKVFCLDEQGKQIRRDGKDHVLEASSPVEIEPGEDFTTTLRLTNHREARNAKVQITYAEFADRTWWRGKMEKGTY